MAEWLVEHGIGEERALLVEGGEALAANVRWPGELSAGQTLAARLAHCDAKWRRGTALDEKGREILVDRLPAGITEGAHVTLEITRAAMAERGRFKRAQGRVVQSEFRSGVPPLTGTVARRLPDGMWEDVWNSASSGEVEFAGGSLLFSVTPAMTVVDVDGDLAPRDLALAAVPALVRSLRLFDLGGSIGVDFPSLDAKADRKAVDSALGNALGDWPHERTAMNGFGFVHIVARLSGPSLLHRFATRRVGMAARLALRRAEMLDGPGATRLAVHPALKAKLRPEWLDELQRRTGRPVQLEIDPALAIEAPQAQLVPL